MSVNERVACGPVRNKRRYTGLNLNSTRPTLTWSPGRIEKGESRISGVRVRDACMTGEAVRRSTTASRSLLSPSDSGRYLVLTGRPRAVRPAMHNSLTASLWQRFEGCSHWTRGLPTLLLFTTKAEPYSPHPTDMSVVRWNIRIHDYALLTCIAGSNNPIHIFILINWQVYSYILFIQIRWTCILLYLQWQLRLRVECIFCSCKLIKTPPMTKKIGLCYQIIVMHSNMVH